MTQLIQNQTSNCELMVPTHTILRSLQLVLPVVPAKSNSTPIIENFLIEISGGYLKVTGYDHKNTIIADLELNATKVKGSVKTCLNAHILVSLLKTLSSSEEAIFSFTSNNLTINSSYGQHQVFGLPELEFPQLKYSHLKESIAFSSSLVAKIVAMNYACSTDDLRPALKGIYFNIKPGKAEFVATNGYIIHIIRRTDIKTTATAIIPGKELSGLAELVKYKDYVNVSLMENHLAFATNESQFITTKIAENFPDYDWAFSIPTRYKLKISKYMLQVALERISILQPTGDVITLVISKDKTILKAKSDFGAVEENFEIQEYVKVDETAEDEITISCYLKKLLILLKHLDNTDIFLCISAPNKLLTLTPVNQQENEEILTMVAPVLTPDYDEPTS